MDYLPEHPLYPDETAAIERQSHNQCGGIHPAHRKLFERVCLPTSHKLHRPDKLGHIRQDKECRAFHYSLQNVMDHLVQ